MRRYLSWTIGFCALSLAGCQTSATAIEGAGFKPLTPSAETRQFIIANDRPFAQQVASHNRTCASMPLCSGGKP
ncbi:MAG: hypothetical protein DI604_20175 [Delftia acidovorans]|nr:MAG: hypothetical protein DI604_20175 [Delftia acidovorans]